jgi:uroporphyrinogen III methyltransferase / synthase
MEARVYLVGSGPGDESLVTLKAIKCIKMADVLVYDNLINNSLLTFCKPEAEKIYAGKKINQHTFNQNEINQLLIDKARTNKVVVRLKGGDPFVFGRGGEEALALHKEGIPFEVVPGVTSAVAVPAYAGIPVTHREISTSFHVITGHEDPTKEKESVDYKALASLHGTLIFLMGLNNLKKICSELMRHGKPASTPVAVISKGTTPDQKIASGTLENIGENLDGITYPAIIVVGEVINLRENLNWFEKKPLFGRKIMVTRARHQASKLSEKIEYLGGQAIEFPTIEIQPNEDESELEHMFNALNTYDWVIFTSTNGVEIFFEKLVKFKKDIRDLGKAKLCAIGDATREALEKRHLKVEFTPSEFIAEKLVAGLKEMVRAGERVLIPRAEVAREILPQELREIGVIVDVIPLYKTIIPEHQKDMLVELLQHVDVVTFASSSTVSNFVKIIGKENMHLLTNIKMACIGPVTMQTAREQGINNCFIAKDYTIQGLVDLLLTIYEVQE